MKLKELIAIRDSIAQKIISGRSKNLVKDFQFFYKVCTEIEKTYGTKKIKHQNDFLTGKIQNFLGSKKLRKMKNKKDILYLV
jgi:hypothetical protein